MAADLRYVYNLRTNHVFLEHKCNFRLDLMYYKSFLINLSFEISNAINIGPSTEEGSVYFSLCLDDVIDLIC